MSALNWYKTDFQWIWRFLGWNLQLETSFVGPFRRNSSLPVQTVILVLINCSKWALRVSGATPTVVWWWAHSPSFLVEMSWGTLYPQKPCLRWYPVWGETRPKWTYTSTAKYVLITVLRSERSQICFRRILWLREKTGNSSPGKFF